MPQFASRLAHPVKRPSPHQLSGAARAQARRGPLDSNDIYDNGPINGNTDAWTINFGFIVSDSFNVTNDRHQHHRHEFRRLAVFGRHADLGRAVHHLGREQRHQLLRSDGELHPGQLHHATSTATTSAPRQAPSTGPTLNAGTYWVNLQNASVPSGDPVYWDENSGVGCTGTGCPSQASRIRLARFLRSRSPFWATRRPPPPAPPYSDYACPGPQPGFHDLHDFSPNAGPSGLAIDTAGKLYGTFANGGSYGAGLLYDFAQRAGHWFVSSLYSFLGGSNGSSPNGVIVGPGGNLYGAADGGILNCNNYSGQTYCGLIYEATPPASACANALVQLERDDDLSVHGQHGRMGRYGHRLRFRRQPVRISATAEPTANGAVFELSPSQGGWTENDSLQLHLGKRWCVP